MEFREAVMARSSIREFKSDPVDKSVIEEILSLAVRAPSWGNTQPWEICVVSGDSVRSLTDEFMDLVKNGVNANPDFVMPQTFTGRYMDRYRNVGREVFRIKGIGREDQEARINHYLSNFNGFNAPHLIYLMVDCILDTVYSVFDTGSLAAHICLAAADRGVGTCLLAALTMYPDVIRRHLGLDDTKKVVLGLAMGYPDSNAPINQMKTPREPLEKSVKWLGEV